MRLEEDLPRRLEEPPRRKEQDPQRLEPTLKLDAVLGHQELHPMLKALPYWENSACCNSQCFEHLCAGVDLSELEFRRPKSRRVGLPFVIVRSYVFVE